MNLGSWVKHASEMDEMGNMNGEEALPAIVSVRTFVTIVQTRHFRRQCIRSVPDLAASAHVRRPHRYTTDGTECTQPRFLERQLWKELLVICSCSSRYFVEGGAVLPALNGDPWDLRFRVLYGSHMLRKCARANLHAVLCEDDEELPV